MNDREALIRGLAALGQCVTAQERGKMFGSLTAWFVSQKTGAALDMSSYFGEKNRDIKRAIELVKTALTKTEYSTALNLLINAESLSNVIESILVEQEQFEEKIQYVTTQPDFIRLVEGAAANSPLWGGTLLDALTGLVTSANESVDIINPYWSKVAAGQLLSGFNKPNINFRILTIAGNGKADLSWRALNLFVQKVKSAGSSIQIFSPTEDQIAATDALAPIHAKVIIQDGCKAYIGSANLSKAGLSTGLEIGLIHTGPTVSDLVEYCDWLFQVCEKIEV